MRRPVSLAIGIVLLFGAVLLPIVGAYITLVKAILPDTFTSIVRVAPAVSDPVAVAKEVELIRSKAVVCQVATNLNLGRKFAERFKEEAAFRTDVTYLLLLRQISVKRIKGTNLIEIRISSEDKAEAATIANEMALVYSNSSLAARSDDGKAVARIVDQAKPAVRPEGVGKVMGIASGAGLGAILAIFGVWFVLRSGYHRAITKDGPIAVARSMTGGPPEAR